MPIQPGWPRENRFPRLLSPTPKLLRRSCSGPRREPRQHHCKAAPLLSCNIRGVEVAAVPVAGEVVLPALAAVVGVAHRNPLVLEAAVRLRRSSPRVPSSILRASANRLVLLPSPCAYSNRYPFAFSFSNRRWSDHTSVVPCTFSCSICVALSNSDAPPFADAFPSAAPSVPLFGKPARNMRDCSHRYTGLLREVAPKRQGTRSKRR